MGFVLDIYVEYLVRVLIRLFRGWGSASWPVIQAKVTSRNYRAGGIGCAVADVTYNYRFDGELYTESDATPFIWDRSAKDYLENYAPGTELPVRVKPGSRDLAVLRQKDLYLQSHGYKLETK